MAAYSFVASCPHWIESNSPPPGCPFSGVLTGLGSERIADIGDQARQGEALHCARSVFADVQKLAVIGDREYVRFAAQFQMVISNPGAVIPHRRHIAVAYAVTGTIGWSAREPRGGSVCPNFAEHRRGRDRTAR